MRFLAIIVLLFGFSAAAIFESIVQKRQNRDMSKNWAVLVAGSANWGNYRHQADICHAYQILIRRGFHAEKIITMFYDDLFNNYSRIDVYKGVKIDYSGDIVAPAIFLLMMRGDQGLKQKGFKVLESTAEDNVFFNFVDHGANGLLGFPREKTLLASDLQDLVTEMSQMKRFKEFLIYIEACESGSLWEGYNLPDNVYATTAANSYESSYACFCDDPVIGMCMGDIYSVNWMNDTETHSTMNRTVEQQYEAVKQLTQKSHVTEFGDRKVASDDLEEFQGQTTCKEKNDETIAMLPPPDQLDSRKAHLARHYQVLRRSNDVIKRREAQHHITLDEMRNAHVEQVIEWIVEASMGKLDSVASAQMTEKVNVNKEFLDGRQYAKCYQSLVKQFTNCFTMNKVPMSAKQYFKFRNLCKFSSQLDQGPTQLEAIVAAACDF
ncbi:hypothetical protein Ciccas_012442 [Cichlidogyrus casuarinus]|uniref:Legumain n=1 Tax=Cichlidogyrus casuarinus TaxID=1844966 RepID=A0ABD2PNE2_9PLAT